MSETTKDATTAADGRPCDCGRPPVKHLFDSATCLEVEPDYAVTKCAGCGHAEHNARKCGPGCECVVQMEPF